MNLNDAVIGQTYTIKKKYVQTMKIWNCSFSVWAVTAERTYYGGLTP